jgi:hypothetical protein
MPFCTSLKEMLWASSISIHGPLYPIPLSSTPIPSHLFLVHNWLQNRERRESLFFLMEKVVISLHSKPSEWVLQTLQMNRTSCFYQKDSLPTLSLPAGLLSCGIESACMKRNGNDLSIKANVTFVHWSLEKFSKDCKVCVSSGYVWRQNCPNQQSNLES